MNPTGYENLEKAVMAENRQRHAQLEWTKEQMVRVTGINRRTIEKRLEDLQPLRKEGAMAIYSAPACFRAAMVLARPVGNNAERLATAQANRAERKDQIESGEVIPTNRVIQAWEDLVLLFRQRLVNAGNNLESQGKLDHAQRVALDGEINSALAELSKAISYNADKIEKEEK
jgi:hypothetical protein